MSERAFLRRRKPDSGVFNVIIAGGGVAALEAALGLRELAGDRVAVTLLSPRAEFVYRPAAVLEPFAGRPPARLPLAEFAADAGATLIQDRLASVDLRRRVVLSGGREELPYDALLVAVGATPEPVLPGTVAMNFGRLADALRDVIRDIDSGSIRRLSFVAPRGAWPLPVYEVALLMRERALGANLDLAITIISEEDAPLALFGDAVSVNVGELLAETGIEMVLGTRVDSVDGKLVLHPGERELDADSVVSVPRLAGPAIAGLPSDGRGFLPVTQLGEVVGAERVYAAGDATDFPVKFGGIAAQQADAVVTSIAALAGADVPPAPFDAAIHGVLQAGWTHRRAVYFSTRFEAGQARESQTSDSPATFPDAKIAARHLGPYLDSRWAEGPRWIANQLAWGSVLAGLEARAAAAETST
jgi:sulfide:quinone oxidoreductase